VIGVGFASADTVQRGPDDGDDQDSDGSLVAEKVLRRGGGQLSSAVPAQRDDGNATALTRTHRPNRRQSHHLVTLPLASVIMARYQQWIDSLLSVVPLGYLGPWGLPSVRCH
jgi:hypothetical protein